MEIIFYSINSTSAKLNKIIATAYHHFYHNDPLLFFVPDQTAWDFLDKLLWSTPPESFLPHPTPLIQLRLTWQESCSNVFNLCTAPLSSGTKGVIKKLYEFEDHTSPAKLKASQDRYHAYRKHDCRIIVES